eukprot:CAMPEP_0197936676 /NCGR_PEP_ID=MMETSP1439-20131203/115336_1 /TAXON_ID=66791 /ORGANISM="Gonyaulax spinifera, Strain CCMP409" /LENGTH=102 /DNA_ID=CAMNT_0043559661 /DNA_START=329 /DNA_END=633 /DNA_ORIENTATION=-
MWCTVGRSSGTVAAGQALEHVKCKALLTNLLWSCAAAQILLVEPSPGTLPCSHGVDAKGVQHHRESGQAAEGWLVLCPELLCQKEIVLHVPGGQGLLEVVAA